MNSDNSKIARDENSYMREFRVCRIRSIYGTHYLAVHEVTFSEGKINWVDKMPSYKTGSISDLMQWHRSLAYAFDKPVIDATTMEEIPSYEISRIALEDELARELHQIRSASILGNF